MRRTLPESGSHEPPAIDQDRRDPHHAGREQSPRRRSLLREDPDIDVVDMATLVQIAAAIEHEAVRRYDMLAELMDSRGEPATATAFRVMLEEERRHVEAVDGWAASVGESVPAAGDYQWRLPADLSSSWDEIAGSALLTPYRAFAMAVENEERAFSFYAYLAAHAENDQVRAEAEKLGAEELRHAALLRRWRRRAYHRERRARRAGPPQVESVAMLRDLLAQHQAAIAAVHFALVPRLEQAGDEAGARLLESFIPPSGRQQAAIAAVGVPPPPMDMAGAPAEQARHLLVDAQKPMEALADELEAVMATAEGEVFEEAAAAMTDVIERLARISLEMGDS